MKELIEFIIKSIVSKPEKVKVEEKKDEQTELLQLELTLDQEDIGKVIGKGGRIIKAIRNLLRVKSVIKGERTVLTIKEDQKDLLYQSVK